MDITELKISFINNTSKPIMKVCVLKERQLRAVMSGPFLLINSFFSHFFLKICMDMVP